MLYCFMTQMAHYHQATPPAQENHGINYSPSDTGKMSDEARKKYDLFFTQLCKYRDALPTNLKNRMTISSMKELAMSLLDDTVFDIVQELEDIQSLSERKLLNKRMKVVGQHKMMKLELAKKHKEDIAKCKNKPHYLPLLKKEHDEEKEALEKKLAEKVKMTDQEVILELDQILSDQQSTLFQAAVPFFSVTNNAQEIQVQIHILRFIQKLSQLKDPKQM